MEFLILVATILSLFLFVVFMNRFNKSNNEAFDVEKNVRLSNEQIGRIGVEAVVVENNSKEFDPCVNNAILVLKNHGLDFQYGKRK